jgi:hypothetical protein
MDVETGEVEKVKWDVRTTILPVGRNAEEREILKHCGKWRDPIPRPPPQISAEPASVAEDVILPLGSKNYFVVILKKEPL